MIATDLVQYPITQIILIMGSKDGLLGIVHHLRNRFGRSLYELCPERVFTVKNNKLQQYSKDVCEIEWLTCHVHGAYLVPKRSVDRLSGAFDGLGEQQHSNAALELPPWKRSSVYKSHMILNLVDILLFQKR